MRGLGQGEGIRNVPNPHPAIRNHHSEHVKPIRELSRTKPVDPDLGRAGEFAPLAMMHGGDGTTEHVPAACLHFYKQDLVVTAQHQIDVAMATAKAMAHHTPPLPNEPARRDAFAEKA